MTIRLSDALIALLLGIASPAQAADCASVVQEALSKGTLSVDSVSPQGVRMVVQHDLWAGASDEGRRALLNNVECALVGPTGQINQLELVSPDKRVLARKSGTTVELLDLAPH